jgi:uncharacterized membrane-anchored protein YitT (DUF2179 family)
MSSSALMSELQWELRELGRALRTWRFYSTLIVMAAGLTLCAIATNAIVLRDALASSGVSGIAVLIYYVTGRPSVGVLYLLLNVPLFILGWREYTLKYIFIASIGVVQFSVLLEVTQGIPLDVHDPLLSVVLAGAMIGVGAGAYLRMGGSAGGLDIVAALLRKRFAIPMGHVFIAINAVNLVGVAIIRDLTSALYSALFFWVISFLLDRVQSGFSQRRAVLIFSDRPQAVAEQVMRRLNRGVSFFHASDIGPNAPVTQVVYSVINMLELGKMKDLLYEVDAEAFVVVYETSEVIGKQFLSWEEAGYLRPPPIRE